MRNMKGSESMNKLMKLPLLKSNNRIREFKQFSDVKIAKVIYEHLFNGRTHRWIDENILIVGTKNNGRISANILYYLGMKAEFRGIFKGVLIKDAIEILRYNGSSYFFIASILENNIEAITFKYQIDDSESNSFVKEDGYYEGLRLEGRKKYYFTSRYERNALNRAEAIETHGLTCFGCGFNFEEVYGERGRGFIEIHHQIPLHSLDEQVEINPNKDLIPLCSNCHRIVHRDKNNVLTLNELKRIIRIKTP